jgi:hypothetical protein
MSTGIRHWDPAVRRESPLELGSDHSMQLSGPAPGGRLRGHDEATRIVVAVVLDHPMAARNRNPRLGCQRALSEAGHGVTLVGFQRTGPTQRENRSHPKGTDEYHAVSREPVACGVSIGSHRGFLAAGLGSIGTRWAMWRPEIQARSGPTGLCASSSGRERQVIRRSSTWGVDVWGFRTRVVGPSRWARRRTVGSCLSATPRLVSCQPVRR